MGNFKNEKISELNAAIYYKNAKFKDGKFEIDSLMLDVLKLLDTWYDGKVLVTLSKIQMIYLMKWVYRGMKCLSQEIPVFTQQF